MPVTEDGRVKRRSTLNDAINNPNTPPRSSSASDGSDLSQSTSDVGLRPSNNLARAIWLVVIFFVIIIISNNIGKRPTFLNGINNNASSESLVYNASLTCQINIRSGPSVNAAKIATGHRNNRIAIIGKSGNWYNIKCMAENNSVINGWVKAGLMNIDSSSEFRTLGTPEKSGDVGTPSAKVVDTETRNQDEDQKPESNQKTDESANSSEPSHEGNLREEVHDTYRYGNGDKMIRIFGKVIPNNAKVKVYVTQNGIRTQYSVVKFSTYAAMSFIELDEQPPEFSQYEVQFYW